MEKLYYLIDLDRTKKKEKIIYLKENQQGYTEHIGEAGIYLEREAREIVKNDRDTILIEVEIIDEEDLLF